MLSISYWICAIEAPQLCPSCKQPFKRKHGGWKRLSIKHCWVTPGKYDTEEGYLCYPGCASKYMKVKTPKQRGRKRIISTPVKRTPKIPRHSFSPFIQKDARLRTLQGLRESAITAIRNMKYNKAISFLLRCHAAQVAFDEIVSERVKTEVNKYPVNPVYPKMSRLKALHSGIGAKSSKKQNHTCLSYCMS